MNDQTHGIQFLLLIAGLSGAGKSTALHVFSDLGFFTIDHLPVPLLQGFLQYAISSGSRFSKTALILDIDSEEKLAQFFPEVEKMRTAGTLPLLVFLDCATEEIILRYSETRRPHPGFDALVDKSLEDAVNREKEMLLPFKEKSNLVIDTTDFNVHELRRILESFAESISAENLTKVRVNFVSFGYKYGIPRDCDLVIDVRFLPNPYFVENLRRKTGLDPDVSHYVLSFEEAWEFLRRYCDLLNYLIPKYIYEGKSYLNIGIGCTGGQHRSVAIAQRLSELIRGEDLIVSVKHRDAVM